MIELSALNTCENPNSINDGDLLVIQRKRDKRKILVRVVEVINRRTGNEEVILSKGKNDYFIWSMYVSGESWVWRVWHLPDVEITSITNNMNEFPR